MAFCKNCGTDISDANVCSACGAVQVAETPVVPVASPVETPSFSADPASYSSTSSEIPVAPVGYQGSMDSGSAVPTYSPSYSATSEEMPSTTGMVVFSIINIVVGLITCCCGFLLPLVGAILGIIALVFSIQAGKLTSAEEAKAKLKTAKMLNIIGVCCTGVGLLINIIWNAVAGTLSTADYMNQLNSLSDLY